MLPKGLENELFEGDDRGGSHIDWNVSLAETSTMRGLLLKFCSHWANAG
jgi:hypothetical protein